jgi:hypothetical protein
VKALLFNHYHAGMVLKFNLFVKQKSSKRALRKQLNGPAGKKKAA